MAVIQNVINANSITPLPTSRGGSGVSSPTAHGILVAEGSSPFNSIVLTNGQLLIGSTGNDPVAASISGGSGINVVNAAGSITISTTATPTSFVNETSAGPTAMVSNTTYLANSGASLCSFSLPTTSAQGDTLAVVGSNTGLWTITQAASQQIFYGDVSSTAGTGGSVSGTLQYDVLRLRCNVANVSWIVESAVGNHSVV
jgi:hypothetical protein